MIRWTFFFDEGNIKTDVTTEEEDHRIAQVVESESDELLYLPGEKVNLYVRLPTVKCIAREIVDSDGEKKSEFAPASA